MEVTEMQDDRSAKIHWLLQIIADGKKALTAAKRVADALPGCEAVEESIRQQLEKDQARLSVELSIDEGTGGTVVLCKCGALLVASMNSMASSEMMDELAEAAAQGGTVHTMSTTEIRGLPTTCSCKTVDHQSETWLVKIWDGYSNREEYRSGTYEQVRNGLAGLPASHIWSAVPCGHHTRRRHE